MFATRITIVLLGLLLLSLVACGGGGGGGDTIPIYGVTDQQGGTDDPFADFDSSLVVPDAEVFRDVSSPGDDIATKWKKNFYDPLPASTSQTRVYQNVSLKNWADRILSLTNQERGKAGLSPLEWDPHLERLAQAHARDMGLRNFFAHDNPYGMTPWDRFSSLDPSHYDHAGENAARGQESPEELVSQWITSPKHRANILNPEYTHLGIGCYFNKNLPRTPSNFVQFFCEFIGDPNEHDWYEPGEDTTEADESDTEAEEGSTS